MKKTLVTLFFIGIITILMARNSGVATIMAQDRTGSPVGITPQCGACHTGGGATPTLVMQVLDSTGAPVTSYNPGQTYTYEVVLSTGGSQQFGFQTVALLSSNNFNAGSLTAQSSNTKTVVLGTRTYAEQVSKSSNGTFTMNWTAPAAGSGDVKFYAAGVAVNANNAPSGDKAKTASPLVLTENPGVTSVNEKVAIEWNLYPTLATNEVTAILPTSGETTFTIFDLTGKPVFTQRMPTLSQQPVQLNVQSLSQGVYLVLVKQSGHNFNTQKLIKQ